MVVGNMKKSLAKFSIILFLFISIFVYFYFNSIKAQTEDFTIICDKEVYICLSNCEAICNVSSNVGSQTVNISAIFNHLGVEPKSIYRWENITYNETVYDFGNITKYKPCDEITSINSTTINCMIASNSTLINKNIESEPICWDNCYDDYNTTHYWTNNWEVVGSHDEEKWKFDWVELNYTIKYSYPEIMTETILSNHTFKFNFKVPISSSGKFNIIVENSDYNSSLDPWWNSSYGYRYRIVENTTTKYSVSVNDNTTVSGTPIWAEMWNDSYLYCSVSGCASGLVAVANDTDQKFWQNETDVLTAGNSGTSVWNSSYMAVWHFGEGTGTDFQDATANNKDAYARQGGTWTSSGKFGKAWNFSSGSYLNHYINAPDLDFATVTIEVWINPGASVAHTGYLFDKRSDSADRTILMYDNADGTVACGMYNTLGATGWPSTSAMTMNTWNYIACVFNGTHVQAWRNGILDATAPLTGSLRTNNINITIGNNFQRGATENNFEGLMDEYRISNMAYDKNYFLTQYYNGMNNLTRLGAEEISLPPPYISVTFNYSSISFGNVTSPSTNNTPKNLNQTLGQINTTIDTNANYKVSASGTNFTYSSYSFSIANLRFDTNSTTTFDNFIQLSQASQDIDTYSYTTKVNYHACLLNVPANQYAANYTSTVTITYANV
jgi:hypothetical protein